MEKIWVLAADNSRARIFETTRRNILEKEIETRDHPESRQSNQDIITDRPGRMAYPSSGEQRKAYMPATDPKKHEVMQFAREVGEMINKAAIEKKYDKIYILAPPSFLGMLRNELDSNTRERISREIDKNVTQLKMEEIREYLPEFM
ncbi:MAG: host attachment protein [Desulfonatronovibrio sp.]